jgi:hypothetical protein
MVSTRATSPAASSRAALYSAMRAALGVSASRDGVVSTMWVPAGRYDIRSTYFVCGLIVEPRPKAIEKIIELLRRLIPACSR